MSNVISSNLLKYKVNKNIDGSLEIPKVFLMSRNLRKRGQIAPIEGLVVTPKFTEANECSFTIYKENNGITLPLFDKIKDNAIIKIDGFGLFQIKVSLHETDTIYKEVTGQRMQACELGQCKCTLEINTADDIARSDYNKNYPTVFYRPDNHPEASLLHRVLTYAPTYSIGYVDPSLYNLNREFSCKDQSVYDFLQEIAQEIGCVFVFTPDKRVINVFDTEDHCTNSDCNGSRHIVNGVCQKCKSSKYIEKGYGLDSSTFLDTHNLLEEITDTIDADSIKNCFKLVAGDDTTTNLIGQRLIGNSPYIWTFSDFEIEEFSDELREKWLSYEPFVETYQEEFNKQWDIINDCINQKLYWMSGKMPVVENPTVDSSDPTKPCKNIYDEITSKITYTTLSSKKTVETTVANQVLNYAKLICPEGYEVSYQVDENGKKKYSSAKNSDDIITSFTAYIYICLKNCKDEQDSSKDRYFYKSEAWTIPVKPGYDIVNTDGFFTTDYFLYLKQQLDIVYAKADMTYQPKYDTDYDDGVENHLDDPDYYKNYFKEYGIQRLTSFKEAYDTCTVTLFEQNTNLTDNSDDTERKYIQLTGVQSKVSLYEELSGRYIAYSAYIETIIEEYTKIYNDYEEKRLAAKEQVDKINAICNLKTYLGDQLFSELLTFKREDTYENKNYSSDVVDEATLMSNIEEFIVAAKQEIAKACQPKHEISVKMAQLLTLSDYETVVDAFAVGNYVRSRINGEIVKMRIVSIPINFTDIEQSDVTFSDSLVGNSQLKSMQEQIQKASSMATSFSFVEKQSERNNEKVNSVSQSISDGLNATQNMIMNSENQDVIMDTHGLLGRELDPDSNTYLPEQYRLTNKGLIFTNNGWTTIKEALGKIFYNDEWQYGVICDALVGKLIAGEKLEISDIKGSVKIDSNGIKLSKGAIIDWDNVDAPSMDNIDGLSEFQNAIQGALGVTKITASSILSPKLGGGYMMISKDGCSVEIDPSQLYNTANAKVINIKANNNDIFYINRNGSAYYAGDVAAKSLTLDVGEDQEDSNYLNITKDGLLTARNAVIYGTIYATSGTFTGEVVGGSVQSSDKSRKILIKDGRINFGDNIYVDSGYLSDSATFSSTLTFSCKNNKSKLALRWDIYDLTSTSHKERIVFTCTQDSKLQIGEASASIGNIYAEDITGTTISANKIQAKNFCIEADSSSSLLYNFHIPDIDYYLQYQQYGNTFSLLPSTDNIGGIGSSDNKWSNIYAYAVNNTSDRKLKKNIQSLDMNWAIKFIDSLKPSRFQFKNNMYGKIHTGFIAQEVEDAILSLGMKRTDFAGLVKTPKNISDPVDVIKDNFDGDDEDYNYSLRYDDFIAPIVAYCQNLRKENIEFKTKLDQICNKLGITL